MSTKNIIADIGGANKSIYCVIQRTSDSLFFTNNYITPFSASVTTIPLVEDIIFRGVYKLSTSPTVVWPDGRYFVKLYTQVGEVQNITLDTAVDNGSDVLYIKDDKEINNEFLKTSISTLQDIITTGIPYVSHKGGHKTITYSDGSEVIVR